MTNAEFRMTKSKTFPKVQLSYIVLCVAALFCAGCVHNDPADEFKPLPPEPAPHLVGKVVGNIYYSADGHFSVPFPVSREIQGRAAHDDPESVLFNDNWGSRIGFSSGVIYPQSPMADLLKKEGREKALDAYAIHRYGDLIVPHYHPDILGGAVSFTFVKPVGPKTGVALFIHDNRIYLVETDLLPAAVLLSKDDDAWLENRAIELLQTVITN